MRVRSLLVSENISRPESEVLLNSLQNFFHRIARLEASICLLKDVILRSVEAAGGLAEKTELENAFARIEREQPALRLEEADQLLALLRHAIRHGSIPDA